MEEKGEGGGVRKGRGKRGKGGGKERERERERESSYLSPLKGKLLSPTLDTDRQHNQLRG